MDLRSAALLALAACGRIGFAAAPDGALASTDARTAKTCDIDLGDAGPCSGASCVQTIASGLGQPFYVVADCTNVYWTDWLAGTVMSCPVGGCGAAPALLASGLSSPAGIVIDISNLYWANFGDGTIDRCAIADCAGTTRVLVDHQPGISELAIDGASLYWNRGDGNVMACATAGCNDSPRVLAADQPAPSSIAVAHDTVYWTTYYGASVMACASGGCGGNPTAIVSGTGDTAAIAAGPLGIFWREIGGAVNGCPFGVCDGGFAMLAPPDPPDGGNDAGGVTFDADFIYWSIYDATGSVLACEANNCAATTTVLASNLFWPRRLAVAAGYVFWTDYYGGSVMRLQK